MSKRKTDIEKLNSVTSTIVHELNEVGLFHYNKLTYLFEYFYIKNYGERFTKEQFCKLPKGPVIPNYPIQIKNLVENKYLNTDLSVLLAVRNFDETADKNAIIKIFDTRKTTELILNDPDAYYLLLKVIEKYHHMNVEQLGDLVYKTPPMIEFKKTVVMGYAKEKGGYILSPNNIKVNKLKSEVPEHIKLSRKYYFNSSVQTADQDLKDKEEFKFLESYRV